MQILVSTDNHINGSAELVHRVEVVIDVALGHFGDRITRVEVYLSDENGSQKFGNDDKRCVLEARLAGLKPIAVSHKGASLEQALKRAADKLAKTLMRTLGRIRPSCMCPHSVYARRFDTSSGFAEQSNLLR